MIWPPDSILALSSYRISTNSSFASIGYGNIVPVTRAEYFVSCVLQLGAGVMWAYVIGSLTGVAAGFGARDQAYQNRTDQANELIHRFDDPDEISEDDDQAHAVIESKQVAKRIRMYIHNQYKKSNAATCVNSLSQAFPVFESLSPDLQHRSSVLIMNQYLKVVPYLSLRYLSQAEQSIVAMQCIDLEFSSGEIIQTDNAVKGLGRGIFVFRSGCAFDVTTFKNTDMRHKLENLRLVTSGMCYGAGRVLVADDNPAKKGNLQFLTFSQITFIPRAAVFEALDSNKNAWKHCARWMYVRTLLIAKCKQAMSGNDDTK